MQSPPICPGCHCPIAGDVGAHYLACPGMDYALGRSTFTGKPDGGAPELGLKAVCFTPGCTNPVSARYVARPELCADCKRRQAAMYGDKKKRRNHHAKKRNSHHGRTSA